MSIFMLLTAGFAMYGQSKAPYKVKVLCGVVKSDSWTTENTKEGIYELVLDDTTLTKLTEEKDVYQAPLGGAVYEDGTMKGIHFKTVWDPFDQANTYVLYHVQYDMETWTRTFEKVLGDMDRNYISSCGMTHDPVTGANYGIFFNFNMSWQVVSRKLATIDFSTPVPTRNIIGTVTTPMAAIACDGNGMLYGVGQDGWLYSISTTAVVAGEVAVTPVADLGVDNISTNPSSMVYNQFTGKFLWSVVLTTGKSCLYEVDATPGGAGATLLMQVPDNAYLVNLFIPDPLADVDAPDAVSNLSVNFPGQETTGTVTFTAPTTSYTGEMLNETLTYSVTANDEEVATGEVEPGGEVTAQVTVEAGDVVIAVTVANQAGVSPETKVTVYVGPVRPLAPGNVKFDYDASAQVSIITWDAPVEGENGVSLTSDELTYNVYLMPADELVCEGLTETKAEVPFAPETLASYYYKVEAINAGMVGQAAMSNNAVVGPALNVPYAQTFATADSFELLTVLDNNNNGKSWVWDRAFSGGGRAYIDVTGETANDDWLLSPPINLEKGATYSMNFEANCYTAVNVCSLEVAYGQGLATADYMPVMDVLTISTPVTQSYTSREIIPASDGVYYFGFHDVSLPHYGALILKNFSIKKIKDAPQPTYIRGDVNGDGMVDVEDVNAAMNIALLPDEYADTYPGNADLNDDGMIDVEDVNLIINIALGL